MNFAAQFMILHSMTDLFYYFIKFLSSPPTNIIHKSLRFVGYAVLTSIREDNNESDEATDYTPDDPCVDTFSGKSHYKILRGHMWRF